jgi:hypothetical protein
MLKTLSLIVAGALAAAAVTITLIAKIRRRRADADLTRHPERLEQMLDPTDDA